MAGWWTLMQPIPASTETQIDAVLNDRLEELFEQHGLGQEALVNLHLYLTITRSDLLNYFAKHPGSAGVYFASHARVPHDEAVVLQRTESGYAVWVSDRGTPRFVKTFLTLEDAVAEYILAVTGRLTHGDR
jgi:hypothetical protein